ncbi:hypothetical protein B0H13DRAFT_1859067 [Mycena leptocephala]|nr:hypothetical protein B0H13DRAFT_1859067 [Mycena leptocephala]
MEQLRGIRKELGMESDGKERLLEKCRKCVAALRMPEPPAASEANVRRNNVEWLTQMPRGQNFSIARTDVLEETTSVSPTSSRASPSPIGTVAQLVQGNVNIFFLLSPARPQLASHRAHGFNQQFFRFSVVF